MNIYTYIYNSFKKGRFRGATGSTTSPRNEPPDCLREFATQSGGGTSFADLRALGALLGIRVQGSRVESLGFRA